MNEENNRVIYLDILRVFAIFCMMMLHVAAVGWHDLPLDSYEWQVLNAYDSIVRFCVPVFIMLSGAFLLNPEKKYSIKNIYTKKIFRMVTAFVFWSATYALVRTFIMTYFLEGTIDSNTVYEFFKLWVIGHYHLWFIFTLIGLYLIAPFLRKITENVSLMKLFIILAFVFVSVVEVLNLFPAAAPIIALLKKKANFYFVLGYSGYFVAGYYFFKYELSRVSKIIIYILGVISIFVTILGTYYLSVARGALTAAFFSYTIASTAFVALAVFIFFKDVVSRIKFSEKATKRILLFSKLSFGMYLFHDYVNIAFRYMGIRSLDYNPLLSVPLMTITVFLVSFIAIWLISKIPFINKYIM